MFALRTLLIVFGIVLVAAALADVFQSVVVPRAVGRRLRPSYYLSRTTWRFWPSLTWWIYPNNDDKREDLLAMYAPMNLVLLLMFWSFMLLVGYGSIFWALRNDIHPPLHTVYEAYYFAGTSFFTIGFGDFVGGSGWTRLISLAAGASGFGVISTTTAFLFAIFGAFQTREQFVVTVGARSGSPPSGVQLLEIAKHTETVDDLSQLMRESQRWAATLMETHLAYPILGYFRSSHDNESWVGTLGTLLDAATLLMCTIEGEHGQPKIFYNIGRHATFDLARYYHVDVASDAPGIGRDEFEMACDRLETIGYVLHDRSESWAKFAKLRGAYAANLNALARFFQAPPLQWVGDRSMISPLAPPH